MASIETRFLEMEKEFKRVKTAVDDLTGNSPKQRGVGGAIMRADLAAMSQLGKQLPFDPAAPASFTAANFALLAQRVALMGDILSRLSQNDA